MPPTRLTKLDVYAGFPVVDEPNARENAALEAFVGIANDAVLLYSWYLKESGGIPSNHSFMRVVAQALPEDVRNQEKPSPLSSDFEEIQALADFSILGLSGDAQEIAAMKWLYSSVSVVVERWGGDPTGLEVAYSAAIAKDPDLARNGRQREDTTGTTSSATPDFWRLIATLGGRVGESSCASLARTLAQGGAAAIAEFEGSLYVALARLDREENRDSVISDISDANNLSVTTMSDDMFLYARCAVVAAGYERWRQVAEDPAAFSGPWDLNAERLLAVPELARELL